jgi:hypothetical protein
VQTGPDVQQQPIEITPVANPRRTRLGSDGRPAPAEQVQPGAAADHD